MILIGDHHMERLISHSWSISSPIFNVPLLPRNIAPFFGKQKVSDRAQMLYTAIAFLLFFLKKKKRKRKIDAGNSDFDIDLGIWKVTFFGSNY